MRNVGYSDTAYLTADGCVSEIGVVADDACCPPDICNVDACSLMCSFIELLPNGPLWDRAKAEGMARYQQLPCGPTCRPDEQCASLVDYAAYSGYRLASLIQGPLWAAIREANPYTAVDTLDSWLSMHGWEDCWGTVCRDPRLGPSPFECGVWEPALSACDANFSPIYIPEVPARLAAAVKRGIVIALTRLQRRPIKNLCGINWIIEPLGAFLRPIAEPPMASCCSGMQWEICNLSGTIEAVPNLRCENSPPAQIGATFTMRSLAFNPATGRCEPIGDTLVTIWPAILAAQCIATTLIQVRGCETPIRRCAELGF